MLTLLAVNIIQYPAMIYSLNEEWDSNPYPSNVGSNIKY